MLFNGNLDLTDNTSITGFGYKFSPLANNSSSTPKTD
jgi:hypothetical protein